MPSPPAADRPLWLITGIPAVGKSTVAQALAERLPAPSVHVHGDQFRRWIVDGRIYMAPAVDPGAVEQLRLRHRLTVAACDHYRESGFPVVAQDVVLGPHLPFVVDTIRSRPLHVVVLIPRTEVVAVRAHLRSKDGYGLWTVDLLDDELRHRNPGLGLWLDTSMQTVGETVQEILRRRSEAVIET